MNNKGFALSGIVYSILVLFLLLIFGILGILGSRKMVLDKMKNEILNELNDEVVNNIYRDDSGANYPRLTDQMIPVLYSDDKNSWVYADLYEKWYDYDEKMWANAVVLKKGITKTVGQTISEDEIALMYVWIPRFKYTIFNANGESIEEKQIEITFEKNTNTTGTVKCIDAINQKDANGNIISEICTDTVNTVVVNNVSTYTHPAFTFGNDKIDGFWVGKFENSTADLECLESKFKETCNKNNHVIEINANLLSLTGISFSNMFDSVYNIKSNYGINNADSHIIKNMEWGAVVYLTQSKYGRCTDTTCEQIINNNSFNNTYGANYTGCAADNINVTSENCDNPYNTQKGMKASTTDNIYGVYDMAGGSWEGIMGVTVNTDGSIPLQLTEFVNIPNEKYYDKYSKYADSNPKGKLGDATFEMTSIPDIAWLSYPDKSWLYRGGHALNLYQKSFYTYLGNDGHADSTWGYRSVLVKQ